MNTFNASPAVAPRHAAAAPAAHSGRRWTEAAIVGGTGLLAFAPVAILGPAIGWPASLGAPPAQQLAGILRGADAVATGYGAYLLYSVLILPVMLLVARRVFGGLAGIVAQGVVAWAALSVLARSIGILRWLTVMPQLATAHAAADPAQRQVIETVFHALTTYGGGIGELLGVGLFMALSLGVAMVAALGRGTLPRWLAGLGLLSAALLGAMLLPSVGIEIRVPVAVAASLVSVWMLAYGAWALSARAERSAQPDPSIPCSPRS